MYLHVCMCMYACVRTCACEQIKIIYTSENKIVKCRDKEKSEV